MEARSSDGREESFMDKEEVKKSRIAGYEDERQDDFTEKERFFLTYRAVFANPIRFKHSLNNLKRESHL